ncbi:MAG: maleylpyruvate isomerase mycothiol-dependent enzyme family protein [Acidimicrobiales bacterium]
MPSGDRSRLSLPMGPLRLGWEQFLAMRLNEHLVHEWDIAVALDPGATLAADGTEVVVDNLARIAPWTGRADGEERRVTIVTTAPQRSFEVTFGPDHIDLGEAGVAGEPTLTMPAEALIRLVYGRLDPDHTPPGVEGDAAALDGLRRAFPGM